MGGPAGPGSGCAGWVLLLVAADEVGDLGGGVGGQIEGVGDGGQGDPAGLAGDEDGEVGTGPAGAGGTFVLAPEREVDGGGAAEDGLDPGAVGADLVEGGLPAEFLDPVTEGEQGLRDAAGLSRRGSTGRRDHRGGRGGVFLAGGVGEQVGVFGGVGLA